MLSFQWANRLNLAGPIFGIDRRPLVPTPNSIVEILVNATSDEYWWGFELSFSVVGNDWTRSNLTKIHEGASWGIYRGEIPAYPLDTEVAYFVSASDMLGLQTSSPIQRYTVFQNSQPSIQLIFLSRSPETEIMVSINVTDPDSGIETVTARYNVGPEPDILESDFAKGTPLQLAKVAGSEYDSGFLAFIPPQPNGTWVEVAVLAEDKAGIQGNARSSTLISYPRIGSNSFLVHVRLIDLQLDENPPRATFEYEFYLTYAGPPGLDQPSLIPVWFYTSGSPLYYEVHAAKQSYEYYARGVSENYVTGDKAEFPFDSYTLVFNVTTAYTEFPNVDVSPLGIGVKLSPYWDQQDCSVGRVASASDLVSNLCLRIVRKRQFQVTILLPLVIAFLMIIATWFQRRDENSLRNSLTVYLGIFVVSFAFLTSIREAIPAGIFGLAFVEQWVYVLLTTTGISTVLALLVSRYRTSEVRASTQDYPHVHQLLQSHPSLSMGDIATFNIGLLEGRLCQLSTLAKTYESLRAKFQNEVLTADEFIGFLAEVRFGALLRRITRKIEFLQRSESVKRPDLKAEISGDEVFFEITIMEDPTIGWGYSAREYAVELDETIQRFHSKLEGKLRQAAAANASFLLVVEPHQDWNAGLLLQQIQRDLEKDLSSYSTISGLVLLYPETIGPVRTAQGPLSRPQGILIENVNAKYTLSKNVVESLREMLV